MGNCTMPQGHPTHCGCEKPDAFEVARHSKLLVEQLRAELAAVTEERDKAVRDLAFAEQWYAVRFERLADLGKSAGCWDAMAAIIANGTADPYETPTYAQQLVRANHRADVAERERDQLRAEAEALRKDAERYRWLRNPDQDAALVLDKMVSSGVYEYRAGDELDAAIDAAMAAKDGQP